jgi:hypothetical protein
LVATFIIIGADIWLGDTFEGFMSRDKTEDTTEDSGCQHEKQ